MTKHDPFNPEQSREDLRREKLVQDAEQASDVKRLMATDWGRRLMWSWLEFTGVYRPSFAGSDHARTDFNEGVRNVGLMLLSSVMAHAPEQFAAMQAEAQEAQRTLDEERERKKDERPWPLRVLKRIGA